jgi:hypothetical protein
MLIAIKSAKKPKYDDTYYEDDPEYQSEEEELDDSIKEDELSGMLVDCIPHTSSKEVKEEDDIEIIKDQVRFK